MAITLAAAARVAACDAIVDLIDVGAGDGVLRIYQSTGTPPDPDAVTGLGTLLAELTMNATAFGAASDDGTKATATANAITADTSANASGTADYFRISDVAGTVILQGSVSATGAGGDLQLTPSAVITSGGTVSISALTVQVDQVR